MFQPSHWPGLNRFTSEIALKILRQRPCRLVPFLFVSSPTLLMQGTPSHVTLAVITAVMGVYLVSVAVAGFMTRPVGPIMRAAFAASGLAMMVPANAFPGALWTDIAGFVVGAGLILMELGAVRRARAATEKAV
jgi:TRAP-type uncharacterized transport system fused permease subunit